MKPDGPKFPQLDRLADYGDVERSHQGRTRRRGGGTRRASLDILITEDGRKPTGEEDDALRE